MASFSRVVDTAFSVGAAFVPDERRDATAGL
jgi:hypothetical protein